MVESMKENMLMTRKKVTVSSTGQMVESTKVAGRMANNMALEPTLVLVAELSKESGPTERDLDGCHNDLHFVDIMFLKANK